MREGLPGVPSFHQFVVRDVNPLGHTKKRRIANNPNKAMRVLHKRLIRYIRQRLTAKYGKWRSKPTSSPKRNVLPHRQNRFFYLTDLHDAYGSVRGWKLAQVLRELDHELASFGNWEKIYRFLKKYFLNKNDGLVTGGNASPDLFHLYALVLLDEPLKELCKRYGITYSRYMDDLTFSSKEHIGQRKKKKINQIIRQAGFELSERKTGYYDLTKWPIIINGVGLEYGGRIFLPRHYLRKINGIMNLAIEGKVPPGRVHGRMGAFHGCTEKAGWKYNRTERKLIKKHQAIKQLSRH